MTNTSRTLRALRQEGIYCGMVERFNQYAGPFGQRTDLFGFIDIIALFPIGICGVQSCGQAFSAHNKKILNNEIAPEWLKAGGSIQLWGWRKIKAKRGGKLMLWKPRIKIYTLEDFND